MSVLLWLYHGLSWTWGGTPFRSAQTGYNIVSGDVGDLSLLGALGYALKHFQCHVDGCRSLGHNDPDVHAPACRAHHSHRHLQGKTAEQRRRLSRP